MPTDIHSAHALFLLIAFGILIGLGWSLVSMAVQWPSGRVAWAAGVICVLLLVIAYLV